jgi:hypothetical protein
VPIVKALQSINHVGTPSSAKAVPFVPKVFPRRPGKRRG